MPRRTSQRVRIVDITVEHRVDSRDRPTSREQGDLIAAVREWRALAGVPAVARRQLAHSVDIFRSVEAQHLLKIGRARLELYQIVRELGDVEQVVQSPLGVGILPVLPGLHPAPQLRVHRPGASGVVPHIQLVKNPSGPALSHGNPPRPSLLDVVVLDDSEAV